MIDARAVGSTANAYALLAKLASGGMADLYLARTTSNAGVQRYVVLKRVLSQRADDVHFVNMFLDEAWLASQLHHPNIAQVFDTGKLGDSYFFTMEYVHGETVRDMLYRAYDAKLAVPLGVALTIVAGACAGLAHAHERTGSDGQPLGIVHRDVSPSNIMIGYEGHVKLVDFGVAKATRRSVETVAGTIKGKVGYMAPEQCRGGDVDARADLFSLGIVMWEILAADRLWKRATDFETMEAIDREPAPAVSTRRQDVPPAIDAIVEKLLAKKPADRFQSAHEVLDALEAAAVAIKEPISQPAVRRFLTELFGHRPEPWLAVEKSSAPTESVTVTGVPPLPRGIALDEGADVRLDRLLDLSTVHGNPSIDTHSTAQLRTARRRIVLGLIVALAAAAVVAFVAWPRATAKPPPRAPVVAIAIDAGVDAAIVAPAIAIDASIPVDAGLQDPVAATRAGHYADALAACSADPAVAAANAAACTLAACRERAVESARAWAPKLAKKERATTTEACRAFGVALIAPTAHVKPPIKPPERCDDPMACRK